MLLNKKTRMFNTYGIIKASKNKCHKQEKHVFL